MDERQKAIWGLTIAHSGRESLADRMLRAVDWGGKALRDLDANRTLVQLAFAFESLFGRSDGFSSTSALLAEGTAFIVGDSYQTRASIDREIREFYGDRSGVAHGGDKQASRTRILRCAKLLSRVLDRLATEEPFVGFTTIEDLRAWILVQKYGAGSEDAVLPNP